MDCFVALLLAIIASAAKQSIVQLVAPKDGLLRRYAPRNDEERVVARMERSEIRDRRIDLRDTRIALRSIRATGLSRLRTVAPKG
jgi:hypothetical protein